MTASATFSPLTLIPDWYLMTYLAGEVTYMNSLAAVFHTTARGFWTFIPRLFIWLWHQLFDAIENDSPRLYEMFLASVEAFFAAFLFVDHGNAYRWFFNTLIARAPVDVWAGGCTALAILHTAAILFHDWEWRAYALTLSFVGWWYLSHIFARFGFSIVGAFADPIWIFCLLSVTCLMWQQRHRAGHGRRDRGGLE